MEFCEKCGSKASNEAIFCQKCGFKLAEEKSSKTFNANVKIAHTNETTEKVLKGIGNSFSKAENTYSSTKSKLSKFIKPVISFAILGVIFALCNFAAYYYYTNIYFPSQTEFQDIKLSSTKSEVRLIKGKPYEAEDDSWLYKLYRWEYNNYEERVKVENGFLRVSFVEDKVIKIISTNGELSNISEYMKIFYLFDYGKFYQKSNYWPYSNEIMNTNYTNILNRFGEPSEILLSDDQLIRQLFYKKLNTVIYLKEDKVVAIGIYKG